MTLRPGAETKYVNWRDFTEKVCRPLVTTEDDAEYERLLALFQEVDPYYLAVCLVIAANKIDALKGAV